MNKKTLWIATILLVALFVLSGCANIHVGDLKIVDDPTCETKYAVKDLTSQRCVEPAEVKLLNDAAANAIAGGSSQDPAPAATPDPAAQAAGASGSATCANQDFSNYVGEMSQLIAILDANTGKVPQPTTNFTFNFDHDVLYWTTAAVNHLPAGLQPLIVDGTTGVFCVAGGTMLTVNFSGAYMAVTDFNPSVEVVETAGLNTGCMDTSALVAGINENHADTNALVRWLNDNINDDNAQYLSARIRPNPLGPATYSDRTPATMVVWVRAGMMGGKEGTDWVTLSQGSGIGVYLVATDKAVVNYEHTGVAACTPINPEKDFSFWN